MKSIKEQIKEQQDRELSRLVDWAGNQSRLADMLGVTRQVVYGWLMRGRISATSAAEAEKQSRGLFTKRALRPDVSEWRL